MSEPVNPFAPFFDEVRKIVREEIERALNERKPAKLRFNLQEAAAALNCKPSWLANKVRESERAGNGFPHQRSGRLIYFTQQDLDAILANGAKK